MIPLLPLPQTAPASAVTLPPAIGTQAPDFALTDAYTRKTRHLAEFRTAHRPVALFFFCGCSWCLETAKRWAVYQRSGVLPPNAATVIVYQSSEADEARALVQSSGLDPKRTALLLDGDMAVTESLYHADPCPRLLVLSSQGTVRYINVGEDEQPRKASADLLVARAVTALNRAAKQKPDQKSDHKGQR